MHTTRRTFRAFTLLEMLVVLMILAIAAGVAIPRLSDADARRARSTVDRIAALLSVVAQRQALAAEPILIEHNAEENTLRFLVQRQAGWDTTIAKNPEDRWRTDPLVPAVKLGDLAITAATFDGYRFDDQTFRYAFAPSSTRPTILLQTARLDRERQPIESWTIQLRPQAASPVVTGPGFPATTDFAPIDLDAQGLSEVAW